MKHRLVASIAVLALLASCSESGTERAHEEHVQVAAAENVQQLEIAESTSPDDELAECAGMKPLLDRLPTQLAGEAIAEQYFSCDAVVPVVMSHFAGTDYETFWTFSITARELDSALVTPRWNLPDADEQIKSFTKKAIYAAVEADALLFDNCVNNLSLSGLPAWHQTTQVSVEQHDICIGADALLVEGGFWVARAKTPAYLYAVKVQGPGAKRFATAQAASEYLGGLFRQFR